MPHSKPSNSLERRQERRQFVKDNWEKIVQLNDYWEKDSNFRRVPKDHPVREWIEANSAAAGYSSAFSWINIWSTIRRDYSILKKEMNATKDI